MTKKYVIDVNSVDDKLTITRTNDGFNSLELIGIVDFIKEELLDILNGKPLDINKITRNVVVDENKEEI